MKTSYTYGQENSHVILHVPHGSTLVTMDARDSLIISDEELQKELLHMTDSHTVEISMAVKNLIGTYGDGNSVNVFQNNVSRLVIDPERFPDDREEMNAVGMGAVYTHGSQRQRIRHDDDVIENQLLEKYFHPYAKALEEAVTGLVDSHGRAFILDIHSYPSVALPYELHQEDERPEICIGVDEYHTTKDQIDTLKRVIKYYGYEVKVNSPFSGTYVPLKHYGKDKRVSSIMLEIRRDLYMDEHTGALDMAGYQYLASTLADAVDALSTL